MKELTIRSVAEICGGTVYGDNGNTEEFAGVVLDSRMVEDGYLFIATKGERVDGHSFIPSVFEKGCKAVLCEKLPDPLSGPCILVKDSFQALKDIAAFYRTALGIKVVGITGSVGKTSTKEVIASVLSQKYNVLKTQGNFNNEIGLPLTVLRLREEHEVAVLEMGISEFGEMHRLSQIAKPDICVITNIGQCHLENLGDRDGILRAKTEIFDFANPDGNVCLNGDDDKLITIKEVAGKAPVFFGRNKELDVTVKNIEGKGLLGTDATIYTKDGMEFSVRIPIPGTHMVENAMAATAVGKLMGLSEEEIVNGIASVKAVDGRTNILEGENCVVIDDCYNANPVSMKAALDLLQTADGHTTAVLGDMFELGEKEKEFHFEIGTYICDKEIDRLICIGTLAKEICAGAKKGGYKGEILWLETLDEFLEQTDALVIPGETILVKASHGMHFTKIIKKLVE